MRSFPKSRAARAALAVPALLLVLAACGSDQTTSVAARSTSGTAVSSSGASSSRILDEKTLLPAVKKAVEDQKSVHVSMTSSGDVRLKAKGDVAYGEKRPEMRFTMTGGMFGTGTVEVRVVDRAAYVSAPPMTPRGKFVEIRPGDLRGDNSGPFGGMRHGTDPREMFKDLSSAVRKVTYLGKDTVRGETLQRYRVTVDLRSAPKGEAWPQMMGGQMMTRAPRTATFDLWLDGKALPQRIQPKSAPHGSFVVELSRWGDPVSIDKPPADEIVEFSGHGAGGFGPQRP